ncbi:MAG: 5'-methylthioadenosine/S-adenosylhomocysteine nucleosidase [Lachnospiraceae bacterium]|nr:5'-methylthioadenosine/S-adenosylhomocysteine nucleosidase [Lachnospiraceae bacterium]
MRKIGILCACEKELAPYIENIYNRNTTDYAMILDTVVCTASEFRDTDNEIYSDFPIMEKPVFHADEHLCKTAKAAAMQADWNIHFGLTTTGDIFTENISPKALCIDMETAAAAHTCYMCNIPFIAIRSISDNNIDKGQEAISRNFEKAAYQSYRFVDIMLSLLTHLMP